MDLHVALDGREELVPMSTEATGGALRNHVAVVFRLLRDTFEMRTQRSDGVHCIEDDAKLRSCLEVPSVTLVPNVRSAARTLLEDHHSILPDEYDTALQDALLTDKDLTLLLLEAGADPNPPFESLLERAVLAKDVWAVTTAANTPVPHRRSHRKPRAEERHAQKARPMGRLPYAHQQRTAGLAAQRCEL